MNVYRFYAFTSGFTNMYSFLYGVRFFAKKVLQQNVTEAGVFHLIPIIH
jgi:hypothetical protein